MSKTIFRTLGIATAAALALGLAVAPAQAQRDPAYAAARSSGQVGEKMDGYLGTIGSVSADVRAMVDDLNIRRRAVYAERAQSEGATLEEYARTAGCLAISRTERGEMYQAFSTGTWAQRGAGAPDMDPRCP